MSARLPRALGRDARAQVIPALPGLDTTPVPRTAVVIGGGIAGLAAACGLAERGVRVVLVEPEAELGGRVRSWPTEASPMSRGFHAFFRQYYNLRALLTRAGDLDTMLRPVDDYPVVNDLGDRDSFSRIPRTPPWNFAAFIAQTPTMTLRDVARVDLDAALGLLDIEFPRTFRDLDGVSAAEYLDALRFPERARHLALEVFARSFFADPSEFSAGELVAMFHSYFLGSAEGLLFDVPRDDFDTALWRPLWHALERTGVERRVGSAERIDLRDGGGWHVTLADGERLEADAVVAAAGPAATPRIIAASPDLAGSELAAAVGGVRLAPPFAVWRIWFDGLVHADRPPFLGTAGFGPLDNVSVLERFEAGARRWSTEHGGSVVELHAYALPAEAPDPVALVESLRAELTRVYPETEHLGIVHEDLLIERDCALIGTEPWTSRPEVATGFAGLTLAGDWVRSELPIALMERAATTGWQAANRILEDWGLATHEVWSVPTSGRHWWPGPSRRLLQRIPGRSQS